MSFPVQPNMPVEEVCQALLRHGGDFSKAKIIVREHESDVYICLACWFVEQVPELQGVEIDTHISLITLPAGSSAGIPTEHIKFKMENRWASLRSKKDVDHCKAIWVADVSKFSKPGYMMLDLHVTARLHAALTNIVDAGLSAIPNPARLDCLRKKRTSFHCSIQPWPRARKTKTVPAAGSTAPTTRLP